MEWVPAVFIAFKVSVLGIGMFLAIKWHYDKGRKGKGALAKRVLLRESGTAAVIFVLLVAGLLLLTFRVGTSLGLDLRMP